LNDCDKFQGVQDQVGIGAHKKSADKWSCWSVINHNKHREKYKPKYLVKNGHYRNDCSQITCVAFKSQVGAKKLLGFVKVEISTLIPICFQVDFVFDFIRGSFGKPAIQDICNALNDPEVLKSKNGAKQALNQ
jgi:hypothetical protein